MTEESGTFPLYRYAPYVAERNYRWRRRFLRRLIAKIFSMNSIWERSKSWNDVRALLELIHVRMESDNFHPNLTVAVGREGAIIGSLFALNWRLKPFVSIDRDFSFVDGTQRVAIHEMLQLQAVEGKAVLLIDCEVNTGTTMREMTSYLIRKMGAREVRTMAFARSTDAGFQPDYTGFVYKERAFFPWEYTDAIKEIRHVKGLEERH